MKIGFESADERSDLVTPAQPVPLRGAEAGAVLRTLVSGLGYRVEDEQSVFVIRPGQPRQATQSFLDRTIAAVSLDEVTLGEALARVLRIYVPIEPRDLLSRGGRLSPQAAQRFSVAFSGGTVADLLVAIVRAHGASGWTVTYRGLDANTGRYNPSVGFRTFDGYEFSRGIPRRFIDK